MYIYIPRAQWPCCLAKISFLTFGYCSTYFGTPRIGPNSPFFQFQTFLIGATVNIIQIIIIIDVIIHNKQ